MRDLSHHWRTSSDWNISPFFIDLSLAIYDILRSLNQWISLNSCNNLEAEMTYVNITLLSVHQISPILMFSTWFIKCHKILSGSHLYYYPGRDSNFFCFTFHSSMNQGKKCLVIRSCGIGILPICIYHCYDRWWADWTGSDLSVTCLRCDRRQS